VNCPPGGERPKGVVLLPDGGVCGLFLSFFLSFFLPSSSSLSLRSAVGQQEKIVYIMGKPHQKLAQGFEYVVTPTEYADAWGSSRVGNALAILVPVLFSPEDLQRSSIKELDQNKISALIGEPFSLPLFFFHFSFFIFHFSFLLFQVWSGLLTSGSPNSILPGEEFCAAGSQRRRFGDGTVSQVVHHREND